MIYRGSRYEDAAYIRVATRQGGNRALYRPPMRQRDYEFRWYLVKEGDRMDTIADAAFGDASKWWIIAESNPEVFYPDDLRSGMLVRIPVVGL